MARGLTVPDLRPCSEIVKAHEIRKRQPVGFKPVGWDIGIGLAKGHATDHHAIRGQVQRPGDLWLPGGEGLDRAGLQAKGPRRDQDILRKHAAIKPAADLHIAFDRQDQPDRRIEEGVTTRK